MTNPSADAIRARAFPPMKDTAKKMNIHWYRCPVDPKEMHRLEQKSDVQGLLHALGHLGLLAASGAIAHAAYHSGSVAGFLAALFVHGTMASFLTAPHHEMCHRTVFETKWANEMFLVIYAVLGWNNYKIYRFSHHYHHQYTLHLEGDREEVMPERPSLRALYVLQLLTLNIFGGYQSKGLLPTLRLFGVVASGDVSRPFNSWGPELYQGYEAEKMEGIDFARVVLAAHALFAAVCVQMGQPLLILLVSLSPFTANWWRYLVGVTMHCGLKPTVCELTGNADFRKCVRTVTLDPLTEFLYWHMNWHLEHHMFARVPCYNLAKLHRTCADNMPKPRTVFSAWCEMRETWHRQQTDPAYTYDTPCPPQIEKKAEK